MSSSIRKRKTTKEDSSTPKSTPSDDQSPPSTTDKKTIPTISNSVLYKFIFFSLLVLTFPLATFFTVRSYLDDASIAAIASVIAVNVVALLYIVVAFREDDDE
jgi:hypothetical protein